MPSTNGCWVTADLSLAGLTTDETGDSDAVVNVESAIIDVACGCRTDDTSGMKSMTVPEVLTGSLTVGGPGAGMRTETGAGKVEAGNDGGMGNGLGSDIGTDNETGTGFGGGVGREGGGSQGRPATGGTNWIGRGIPEAKGKP